MLISTSELNSILQNPDVIVADTRSFKEYSEGHIPGAVHLDLFAFHWIDTTKKGIENFNDQARKLFSFLGVTSEKKVIFYDSVSGMLAARGVWMLMYFSHQKVSMLDGGITKWKKENLPTETNSVCEKDPDAFWIQWHGIKVNKPDWGHWSQTISYSINQGSRGALMWMGLNSYSKAMSFELPVPINSWEKIIDTAEINREDLKPHKEETNQVIVELESKSLVVLIEKEYAIKLKN